MQVGLGPAKGKDFCTSIGPWLVTADELEDAPTPTGSSTWTARSRSTASVVGRDRLSHMGWTFATMIAYASRDSLVVPGDLLASGTTGGGGCLAELWGRTGRQEPPPLEPGDVVSITVDRLGTLTNMVVEGRPVPGRSPRSDPPCWGRESRQLMFEYFPGNYIWNLGVVATLNSGGTIDEVDRACRPIRELAAQGSDVGTRSSWPRGARSPTRSRSRPPRRRRTGHLRTAGQKYLRAAAYLCQAERMLSNSSPDRVPTYQHCLELMEKSFELIDPATTRVQVPFEGTTLPAYFTNASTDGAPVPTMIMWNGLDSTKEHMYTSGWPSEMAARGISVLQVDCPGSGEALRLQGLTSRVETEDWAKACVDYLQTRSDVRQDRIGLVGWSLGGYYVPRAAAFEKRLALAVAWGANHNWGEVQKKRLEREGENPVPHYWEHVLWVWGETDLDTFIRKAERVNLNGVVDKITCPFLITHGSNDRQINVAVRAPVVRAGGQRPEEGPAHLHPRRGGDRALRAGPPAARRRLHRRLDRGHLRRA